MQPRSLRGCRSSRHSPSHSTTTRSHTSTLEACSEGSRWQAPLARRHRNHNNNDSRPRRGSQNILAHAQSPPRSSNLPGASARPTKFVRQQNCYARVDCGGGVPPPHPSDGRPHRRRVAEGKPAGSHRSGPRIPDRFDRRRNWQGTHARGRTFRWHLGSEAKGVTASRGAATEISPGQGAKRRSPGFIALTESGGRDACRREHVTSLHALCTRRDGRRMKGNRRVPQRRLIRESSSVIAVILARSSIHCRRPMAVANIARAVRKLASGPETQLYDVSSARRRTEASSGALWCAMV